MADSERSSPTEYTSVSSYHEEVAGPVDDLQVEGPLHPAMSDSERSSPTEYTSVSSDHEEVAGPVDDLQVEGPMHPAGNEAIPHDPMVQLPAEIGETSAPFREPLRLDVDAACVTLCTLDLPILLGNIARPANRQIVIKDDDSFKNWIHVISDPIVVRIYGGDNNQQRQSTKLSLMLRLQQRHGLTLTINDDNLVLSKNQVNVPVQAIAEALHHCGARACRVQFFGMKWTLPEAEPIMDHLIQRYIDTMGALAVRGKNRFDIGTVHHDYLNVTLFKLNPQQTHHVVGYDVHEMLNVRDFGSVEFKLKAHPQVKKVKVYQELVHDVISVVPKAALDDMPVTMRTIKTRHKQMSTLLRHWERMTPRAQRSRLIGTRLETTIICVDKVSEARVLCDALDILRMDGIHRALGGPLDTHYIPVARVIEDFKFHLRRLGSTLNQANDAAPSIRVRSLLTRCRQALGWSGKNMWRHLREARDYEEALAVERQREEAERRDPQFVYPGYFQDPIALRPLIDDFLRNASWFTHGRAKANTSEPLLLRRTQGGGYHKKVGIYIDRVGAARHFVHQFGANWRDHVVHINR